MRGPVEPKLAALGAMVNHAVRDPTVDAVQVQSALLVEFWIAWVMGLPDREQFDILSRAVGVLSDLAQPAAVEARICQAVEWDRAGRSAEAIAALELLAEELERLAVSTAAGEQLLAVWFEKCIAEGSAGLLVDAQRSADAAAEIYAGLQRPSPAAKARFAESQWTRCDSIARRAIRDTGSPGDDAFDALAALIDWLRSEPGPGMRRTLARRLMDKARWLGSGEGAVTVVEEVITLLDETDDRGLTRHVAYALAEQMPELARLTDEDTAILTEALAEEAKAGHDKQLADGRALVRGSKSRSERLCKALSALDRRLAVDPDSRAAPVRALVLINKTAMLARLGRVDEQVACIDELTTLGDVALTACDEFVEMGANGATDRVTMAILKAQLFVMHDRLQESVAALDEIINEFASNSEPLVNALLENARRMRRAVTQHAQA